MDTNLTVCCYLVVIIFTCALRAQALDLGDIPTFPDVVPMPLEEACMRYLSGCKAKTNYTDDPSKQLQVLKSCMVQNSCPRLSEEFLNKVVYVEKKHKPAEAELPKLAVTAANSVVSWHSRVTLMLILLVLAAISS